MVTYSLSEPILSLIVCFSFIAIDEYKKLSYCWETARRDSRPKIAKMAVEMTT